jgi:hypothetical protein
MPPSSTSGPSCRWPAPGHSTPSRAISTSSTCSPAALPASTRFATTAAGASRARRSTSRCDRPGARSTRRSDAKRGRSRSSSRCASASRRAAIRSTAASHRDRITWDAPIHSVADVEALPFPPRTLNCKPSRFGRLRALLEFYDHCEAEGIGLYGGGQSELGVGRGQIQCLASLFHPDTPNDIAPSGWDWLEFPETGLATSPLDPAFVCTGFRRRA